YMHLPLPGEFHDTWGGYTIEVDQVEWGHAAHKRTWLYLVGVPREAIEPPPFPGRQPAHDLMGARGKNAGVMRRAPKEAAKENRGGRPPAFAEFVVRLAGAARKEHSG